MSVAPKVHVHRSLPDAVFVNAFTIEGEKSLVLVDTQFALSKARALVETVAALEKPLAATFVTHFYPDYYDGIATNWPAIRERAVTTLDQSGVDFIYLYMQYEVEAGRAG